LIKVRWTKVNRRLSRERGWRGDHVTRVRMSTFASVLALPSANYTSL